MSLLQSLPYPEYKKVCALPQQHCEKLAELANLKISFNDSKKPGDVLINALNLKGYNLQQYKDLLSSLKFVRTYYKPKSKVAILIANQKYVHLNNLATPCMDCDSLAQKLKSLGFIVFKIKNTTSAELKVVLEKTACCIPEDSYCFIFYAGHGCQLCNTKCMLGADCPIEGINFEHCVTENYVLKSLESCKLDLCVFVMDMCRVNLDSETNPQIYNAVTSIEDYTVHRNLIISYSAQSSQFAYEMFQIELSTTVDCNITYELKTGDTDKIVPGASQYVNALCTRLDEDLDVSTMIDKVHADVEQSFKKQMPIKVQCGSTKRSLYDPVSESTEELVKKLKEVSEQHNEKCSVY